MNHLCKYARAVNLDNIPAKWTEAICSKSLKLLGDDLKTDLEFQLKGLFLLRKAQGEVLILDQCRDILLSIENPTSSSLECLV